MDLKTTLLSFSVACALLLSGCASDSPVAATGASIKHPESITIVVTGGSETPAASASQVSRQQYVADLTKALQQAGLFGKIISGGESGADYKLAIAIADLQKPEIGASMTATVEATWALVRVSNGYEIWKKSISASHTTAANEAFTGVERLRLAVEGAARANIHDGLQQLGTASIP